MKPVLILGKGPSARHVPASDEFDIAALNGAVKLCESARWLFVNDFEAFSEITESDLKKVDQLVLPSELHVRCGKGLVGAERVIPDVIGHVGRISFYRLHTALKTRVDLPYFGRIISVAETAACWCVKEGRHEFRTLGLDPDGGYSEYFAGGPQVDKPNSHFKRNWQAVCRRIRRVGGTIERIQ